MTVIKSQVPDKHLGHSGRFCPFPDHLQRIFIFFQLSGKLIYIFSKNTHVLHITLLHRLHITDVPF